jgi:hypothetical protein
VRANKVDGTSRPSAFAVLRLITSSNLVGCWTGNVVEVAAGMLADRPAVARRKDLQKSRVTNHQDLLPGLDGRSSAARRFCDLMGAYIADMGALDQCSEIRLGLLRRLAATTVQAEMTGARGTGSHQRLSARRKRTGRDDSSQTRDHRP